MPDQGVETRAVPETEVWQVGDLTIDVDRQRVMRGDLEIPLPRLSLDLLLALARLWPNFVSNDELMSIVWPRLVVGPETVVQRVKLLRQALGDPSEEPRYIAALRGRGYRLVANVRRMERSVPLTQSRQRFGGWRLVIGLGVAAAVLALSWRGYLLINGDRDTPQPDTAAQAPGSERAVAVLPFTNLSPDQRDAYMSLSLPEMTLNRLTALPGITVIAYDSSALAGRSTTDPREIGRRLGAAYLVSGSVQRNEDALRITARLVDARTATQLWSRDFAGRITDLFRIQDDIAEQVAVALKSRISDVGVAPPPQARSPNVEAYLAYLRGRALIGRFTVNEAESASREFEKAIELDPTFAAAHAALYDAHMQAVGLRHDDLQAARKRYRPLLDRALSLDPQSGAAWYARAMWEVFDNAERDAAFRKAVTLDPANTRGLIAFSEYLDITDGGADAGRVPGSGFDPSSQQARTASGSSDNGNRGAEADRLLDMAMRIDPLSPRAHFRKTLRDFRRSSSDLEAPMLAILETDPEFYPALYLVALYRSLHHGHASESIALIERVIRNDPLNPAGPNSAVAYYLDVGDLEAARQVAALTPVSARTARPLLAQFVGDWRTAGEAAMTRWGFEFGFNDSWGSMQALRDYALRSRDFDRPVTLLRERYHLPAEGPVQVSTGNFRAAVHLAHLEFAQGHRARAEETLRAVIRWIDADTNPHPVYKRRSRAQALMMLGEADQAFTDLSASFRDDHDYMQWWYTLDRDPVWDPIRSDSRFQVLATEVRAYAARERDAVEALRREGTIPPRRTSTAQTEVTR
jgi:TolB-like protein/DNA-binding winged helix-turn-helix (wHTH) protein